MRGRAPEASRLVVGPVDPRRGVRFAAGALDQPIELAGREALGLAEHQVLEQVRHAGRARALVPQSRRRNQVCSATIGAQASSKHGDEAEPVAKAREFPPAAAGRLRRARQLPVRRVLRGRGGGVQPAGAHVAPPEAVAARRELRVLRGVGPGVHRAGVVVDGDRLDRRPLDRRGIESPAQARARDRQRDREPRRAGLLQMRKVLAREPPLRAATRSTSRFIDRSLEYHSLPHGSFARSRSRPKPGRSSSCKGPTVPSSTSSSADRPRGRGRRGATVAERGPPSTRTPGSSTSRASRRRPPAAAVDDALRWSVLRHAADGDRRVVAFVGTSRMELAYSAQAFAAAAPQLRGIQLAINGVPAIGVLEDLASDPAFQGVAVVDIDEWDIAWGDALDQAKPYIGAVARAVAGAWRAGQSLPRRPDPSRARGAGDRELSSS